MAPTGRGGRRNHNRCNKSTSTSHPTTSKTLPLNLIIQILSRSDVKSLARFRCVSKSWYDLITHPMFIKKHLHMNSLNSNTHVICSGFTKRNGNRNFSKVVSLLRVDKMPVTLFEIDCGVKKGVKKGCGNSSEISFAEFSKKMVLAGSINGVVLVTHVGEFNGRFVGLWNPGVNRWKLIRINREGELSGRLRRTNVGLGFDKSSDDFKIIRIVTESVSETDGSLNGKWDRVDIYSVIKDSWKDVYSGGELLVWSCQYNCNFIVKGIPYFVGVDVIPGSAGVFRHQILAGFDPSTGLFKKVHYPEQCKVEGTWAKPFEYQDYVAIMVQSNPGSPGSPETQTVDMYVLDDNTTSWIKMYSIGPFPYLEYHEPQLSFKTGQIVLKEKLQHRGSYLYDPKANSRTHLTGIDRLQLFWSESYSHSESLVTIEGMEFIRKNGKNKKMNRTELLSKDFKAALRL